MSRNTGCTGYDDQLRAYLFWLSIRAEKNRKHAGDAMKHFQFEVAPDAACAAVPGGWTRDDVAKAVLAHARLFGPERTGLTLCRVAGWKTVENIRPAQYGVCIAHLAYEMTKRPNLAVQPITLADIPKHKWPRGSDDNLA